jgi:hypothetical protein
MTSHNPDFFQRLSNTKQHLIALLILFIIPFVLFTATTIGGKELQRHDTTQWRASAESVIEYRKEFGKEPLWVTNMFAGMPAYVVSVKNIVPNLDRLSSIFRSIYPAFHFWILLSGMYFLLIVMDFRKLSAAFGSLLFGLTSYIPIIIIAGHNSKFHALTYIPWVIAGYWLLSRREKKLPGLLLFMVAMALEMRAGHPQITYYFFYLLGFLWVFDTWNAYQKGELKNWGFTTLLMIGGGIVGILGHAQNLLMLQEYSHYSLRGGSALDNSTGLSSGYAFAWSQGIRETWTMFVPNYFGGASPDYWGPKSFTSGPHYFGAISLPFLLIALFRERSKMMYTFFGVGTLGILFAWGSHFSLLNQFAFDYIPYFDKFRAPETWMVFVAFCYTVVAVYGLNWMADYVLEKNAELKKLYVPLGLSFAVLVFLFVQVNSTDFTRPGEVNSIAQQIARQNQVSPTNPQVQSRVQSYVNTQLVPSREEKAKADVRRLAIILIVAGGLIYMIFSRKISVSVGLFGFLLIAAIDMISVDKRYIPENNIVDGNVDAQKVIEAQRRDIDTYIQDRVSQNTTYPYRVLPLLDNPFSNAIPSYFYPSIGGYSGVKLSIVQDVMYSDNGPLNLQSPTFNPQLLDLLNVKYVTYTQNLPLPGFKQVFKGQKGVVFENENVLPKAFFVDSVITTQDPKTAFNYLMPGQLNVAKTAVVETAQPLSAAQDSSSSVQVTTYNAAEISLKTNRNRPGFLVLSEIYYPAGWHATLDGKEIPIYKTDYLLRGMQVSAGEHTLTLRFEPTSYTIGVTLAWISLIIQIGLALAVGFMYFKNSGNRES